MGITAVDKQILNRMTSFYIDLVVRVSMKTTVESAERPKHTRIKMIILGDRL